MFNLKLLSIALLTLLLVGCGYDQVTRPPIVNRFIVTRHSASVGPDIYTFQDTTTGKCFIALYQGDLLETHPTVCQ